MNLFILHTFNVRKISKTLLNVKFFFFFACQHHFLLDILVLFLTTNSLINVDKFTFIKFLFYCLLNGSSVNILTVNLLLYTISTYVLLKFYFQHCHFCSFLHFHLYWWIPSFYCPVLQMPCRFITGRQAVNTTCFPV